MQSMEQYVSNKSAEMNGIYVHVYEKLTKHGPIKMCVVYHEAVKSSLSNHHLSLIYKGLLK